MSGRPHSLEFAYIWATSDHHLSTVPVFGMIMYGDHVGLIEIEGVRSSSYSLSISAECELSDNLKGITRCAVGCTFRGYYLRGLRNSSLRRTLYYPFLLVQHGTYQDWAGLWERALDLLVLCHI